MGAKQDLRGRKFGRLLVIEESGRANGGVVWSCECECGNIANVRANHLKRGMIVSCGCYNKELMTKHGNSLTKLHQVWANIKDRCLNDNYAHKENYGGRGIGICEEWADSYEAFEEWSLSNGYEEGLTIDRIDNNGDYEPDNCRWTDMKVQCRNRRNNVILESNGERRCLAEWAEITNQPYMRLSSRHRRGWSDHEVIYGRA